MPLRGGMPFMTLYADPFPPSCPRNWNLWGCRNAMPSPGGKGDREAVDEEWRYLPILNVVK